MATSPIAATSATYANAVAPTATDSSDSLDTGLTTDSFLQLLTTQLQNQDPLDPVSDDDFTTQLAQLSSLQGMEQLNSNFSNMLSLQQLTQGANMIGRTVTYSADSSGTLAQGTVSAVNVQNNQLQLLVENSIALSQVQSVNG